MADLVSFAVVVVVFVFPIVAFRKKKKATPAL